MSESIKDDLVRMQTRLRGDPEEDARRGHGRITRKPCPGCGRADGWPYRNADHVCRFCRTLLLEAIKARLQRPETEEELVVVSERAWETRYMEGEYCSASINEEGTPRKRLEVAMHRLSLEVSQEAPGEDCGDHRYLYKREQLLSPMSWKAVRRIRKAVAGILADLDLAVRDSLTECSRLAELKGQNVLLQLAAGRMSVDDLNKDNVRLMRRKGRRR